MGGNENARRTQKELKNFTKIPPKFCRISVAEVDKFARGAKQRDGMTMITVKIV